jgi:hypothetical protein
MKWLDTTLITGPHMCLGLTKKQFKKAKRHLRVKDTSPFVEEGFGAQVHTYELNGRIACIVCLNAPVDITPIQVHCLLVHEAVHIWQLFCSSINEYSPSKEFEAYAIQSISQTLILRYEELEPRK